MSAPLAEAERRALLAIARAAIARRLKVGASDPPTPGAALCGSPKRRNGTMLPFLRVKLHASPTIVSSAK